MKSFKIISSALFLFLWSSCYVGKFIIWNTADLNDSKKFASRAVNAPVSHFYFHDIDPKRPLPLFFSASFEKELEQHNTVAFLVIRNDSILYEKYFDGYTDSTVIPSFSMAKSFVSTLIGVAVKEGKIKSVDEPITNYLNGFRDTSFKKITIKDLLGMKSGIRFNESYVNPFGNVAKYYYGDHIKEYVTRLRTEAPPGQTFKYTSINTELLGLILEKATNQSLSSYLEQKIWQPLQMEYDASWSIDSKKGNTEKAFCCINARTRDFAKLGRLYLKDGNWNGQQIISSDWVNKCTKIPLTAVPNYYSYQWWHGSSYEKVTDSTVFDKTKLDFYVKSEENGKMVWYKGRPNDDYYAAGILGQYIYVSPKTNTIIVRLGSSAKGMNWPVLFSEITEKI
ncbi:MAG: beta-lactamase-like protein with penicillin binding protein transpeptidase domain [Bacteroidetes bacterium]|nr:beta-lactamase-like protein with penicillin binding protein transpeptidase domain [Bacteroidota bacterium]